MAGEAKSVGGPAPASTPPARCVPFRSVAFSEFMLTYIKKLYI